MSMDPFGRGLIKDTNFVFCCRFNLAQGQMEHPAMFFFASLVIFLFFCGNIRVIGRLNLFFNDPLIRSYLMDLALAKKRYP